MLHRLQFVLVCILVYVVPSQAADYYWVGGTGDWSDLSHWATTSGGSVTHSQAPTSNDDVFFDGNSFTGSGQRVSLNLDIIFFRNMDWTGATPGARLVGTKFTSINCFGSMEMNTQVVLDFDGILVFTGEGSGKTINSGGNVLGNEVHFAGSGEWILSAQLLADSLLKITQGTIDFNGQDVRTEYLQITGTSPRNLILGSSTIEVTGEFGDFNADCCEFFDTVSALIHTDNLDVVPGTSTIRYTASRPEIRYEGSGTINFNNVQTTNPDSRAKFWSYFSAPTLNHNELSFAGSAQILGQNNAESLFLSPKKVYLFQAGLNFQYNAITAIGSCSENIAITTDNAGIESIFTSTSDIALDYVTLRDIRGNGGNFTADNSTNLGNNANWAFTNDDSFDFYWIGGTGEWDDPAHWSLTSGGPSSGCVPAGKDDVFFDGNSFTGAGQTVEVNTDDVFVHNMTWMGVTGNPDLIGEDINTMHVTGSLRFDDNMEHTFYGSYFFESNEVGLTIEMNEKRINGETVFSGPMAKWDILDDFYVHGTMYHNSGEISLNSNELDIWRYRAETEINTHLDISGSLVTLHAIFNERGNELWRPQWRVNSDNYSTETNNSTIRFQSGFFCEFYVEGQNRLEYNNIHFESYGGELLGGNFSNGSLSSMTIDSVIFRSRGEIRDNQSINYCELSAGFDYVFRPYIDFRVSELNANGECNDGVITIGTSDLGQPFNMYLSEDHVFQKWIVSDVINMGTGSLTANDSYDGGYNSGIIFMEFTGRTLYWVGDGGMWEDTDHWSLSSGGPPGECIPTSLDDVIFDENSFSTDYQPVFSNGTRIITCHNMTWRNVTGTPSIGNYFDPITNNFYGIARAHIYGSLIYPEAEMNVNLRWHRFLTTEVDSIVSNGKNIFGIEKNDFGELILKDDLENEFLSVADGILDVDDISLYTRSIRLTSNGENVFSLIKLRNSEIHLRNDYGDTEFSIEEPNSELEAGSSTIFLESSNMNCLLYTSPSPRD